ncbi:DUF2264 domain-containing protein [Actinomyces sp. MRS3W]|uniref:DUF2264 domain-containing protein n=1 Tax=Actinomyces sp. MRS3W TaxID=2800796 RepID=UPI0028FD93E3|nr:DUF2264 domain-containing protein [Actinomyces sp. MRS3W]MDU0348915.1 DUF2264 domain-containing protein [Actinomyces sp. MRS3W]
MTAQMRRTIRPTGITRRDWEHWADDLLLAVRPYFTAHHGRLHLPGPTSSYGRVSDGLEGFARTFLLAGFRLVGADGADPLGLADWYREGIVAGTEPGGDEAWPALPECAQAKVEAASVALVLDMTRPWIWDRMTTTQRQRVIDWLAPVVGDDTYPPCNWLWFRVVVETFLRSVGGPWSETDIRADLAEHDSYYVGGGWFSDGPERGFDYYTGWAMNLYPVLWSHMHGAEDLAAERGTADIDRLEAYLADLVRLIGADGAPLFQGRSLVYRFATAAPLWAGAIARCRGVSAGELRRAASLVLHYFRVHGVPDADGLLTLGWFDAWEPMRQTYSGSGSPYWAAKGFLGLSLPEDDSVWTAPEEPLPLETDDVLRAVVAPGWIVSGTRRDGIVRVINHGTDHAIEGSCVADAPLYARLGYSTVTTPCLDAEAETNPLEMSVALLDASGRASHRAGMRTTDLHVSGGVGVGASRSEAHWLVPDAVQEGHGSGLSGRAERAGDLAIVSFVRGPWELRLWQVLEPDRRVSAVRLGGWALTSPDELRQEVDGAHALVAGGELVSAVMAEEGNAQMVRREDASPLPGPTLVPVVVATPAPGRWVAAAVYLGRAGAGEPPTAPCLLSLREAAGRLEARVRWPDGAKTVSTANTR